MYHLFGRFEILRKFRQNLTEHNNSVFPSVRRSAPSISIQFGQPNHVSIELQQASQYTTVKKAAASRWPLLEDKRIDIRTNTHTHTQTYLKSNTHSNQYKRCRKIAQREKRPEKASNFLSLFILFFESLE